MLVKITADYAGNTADIHYSGNAEVEVSALFGDYFARRAEEQGNALNYGGVDKCHNCGKHQPITSFEAFLRKLIL